MKEYKVKTKRMTLRPMTNAEIESLISRTDSEELRTAYREMLDGCKRDPDNRIWYAPWQMLLKGTDTYIGDLDFKGPVKNHSVEIGYGVLPAYEHKGYTTEAVQSMTQWAFGQKDIVFVEAETEPENKASQRILEKCGFVPDGTGAEGPRFLLESPLTNWSAVYMLLGMSIGMALGHFQDQMLWGLALGISLGVLVGVLVNHSEEKSRAALRQRRTR